MFKNIIFILFFLSNYFSLSQKNENENLFHAIIKSKTIEFKTKISFKKAGLFYIEKNIDSTLINSIKYINSNDNNPLLMDYCHFFRADCFLSKRLFPAAIKELNLVSKKFPFYYKVLFTYGDIALEQSKFKEALIFYDKIEKSGNSLYYSKLKLNEHIGLCYMYLKKYVEAEKYLKIAEQDAIKTKDSLLILNIYNNIANLYYEQYKDKQAISYFEKAYLISKTIKDFKLKKLTAGNMAAVEENRNNFKQAIIYRKEFEKWNDSVNDQNKVWAVADFEKKFAINLKQKEIKLLEVENEVKKTQRNGLFIVAFLLLGILGFGIYIYKQKIKSSKIILAQKNDLDELNATKDKLFSIVSHDLRSSVNALKTSNTKLINHLQTKDYDQLDQLLHKNNAIASSSYNLLDNLLNWSLQQTNQQYFYQESLNLNAIVEQVVYNYKPLFFDKNISFESKIDKKQLVFADADSIKIVLRNVLDNAIKFSKQDGTISIYTNKTDIGFCQLIIEDTGIGMSQNSLTALMKETTLLSKKDHSEIIGTGLGIQLCKSMMAKNGGKFIIETEENIGTKIILHLPEDSESK